MRGEALRLRGEHVEAIEALGAAALARAAKQVSEHDFVLLLADRDGVVVRSDGGAGFREEARRVRLIEGASWGEAVRGTNAIGTAAAEARPTVVLGRGHFGRRYHGLACFAAPVLDVRGEVVAVVDATSRVENARPEVGRAVLGAAGVLTELLRLEAYASAGGTVLRALVRAVERSRDAAVLVEAPGRVATANGAARSLLSGRLAGGPVDAIGIGWPALVAEAIAPSPGGREVRTVDGARLRLRAEPVLGARGEALAVLAHLEPSRRPAPALARDPFGRIFARDAALRQAIDWARLVAESDLPVMLLAETGSGKELFAHAIHDASPRAQGPFVALNCGAVAPSLLESELFGYAPGAFTGAAPGGRTGLLHAASGGTLFLDEVAEMPLAMQAALLRVLETGAYHRVGDPKPERCDVRVICATCRDLDRAVADGSFRQDLFYRLKGAAVRLPALRDREDRLPLARHLLAERAARAGWRDEASLSPEAEALVAQHPWPGNVRELLSVIDVSLVTARGAGSRVIDVAHLPLDLRAVTPPARAAAPAEGGALRRAEADALRRALAAHGGNVSAAARELGVARSTLYRMARRNGVDLGK